MAKQVSKPSKSVNTKKPVWENTSVRKIDNGYIVTNEKDTGTKFIRSEVFSKTNPIVIKNEKTSEKGKSPRSK